MRPLKTIATKIGRAAQAGLHKTASTLRGIGLSLGSFLIATAAGAAYAATFELRDALAVLAVSFALFFVFDLLMLRRASGRGR